MIKKRFTWTTLVTTFVGFLLLAPVLEAQGSGGHGHPTGDARYFDPATIETLQGELSSTGSEWEMWGHGNHTGGGLHFELRTADGTTYDLMLAPPWYLQENGVNVTEGEWVTVTGSIVAPYGPAATGQGHGHGQGGPGGGHGHGGGPLETDVHDFLIATELVADGVTLGLRDGEGYPLWRPGPGDPAMEWFEPAAIQTWHGTLSGELGMWGAWGYGNHTGNGMHYLFASDSGETFYAMLGPFWYLADHGVVPERGTEVTLTGAGMDPYWSHYDDHRYVIATEIVIGDTHVPLRDEYGYPLWHGTGWHYYSPSYEQASETSLRGMVIRTQSRPYGRDLDHGYEMIFRSGGQRYVVFIAPLWHVEARGFSLENGRRVTVMGSVVQDLHGRPAVVARQIVVDGRVWRFRNARGNPMWIQGAF